VRTMNRAEVTEKILSAKRLKELSWAEIAKKISGASPVLITADMLKALRPGSVVVDLAAEQGGNCEGSRFGQVVTTENGVRIVAHANVPSRIAVDASQLYARNLVNFLALLIDKDKTLKIDLNDEIVKATLLTRDGAIVHPQLAPTGA